MSEPAGPDHVDRRLIPEPPLLLLPDLARILGVNEAIVLQQAYYWLEQNRLQKRHRFFHSGRWWMQAAIHTLQERDFPFWSQGTVRRTINALVERGLLLRSRRGCAVDACQYAVDRDRLNDLLKGCPARMRMRKLSIRVRSTCAPPCDQADQARVINLIAHDKVEINNRDSTETNNRETAGVTSAEAVAGAGEPAVVVAPLVDRLIELGVTPSTAAELVAEHNPLAVERQLAALPYRDARDPASTLVAALRGSWAMPAAMLNEARDRARAVRTADCLRRLRDEQARDVAAHEEEQARLERLWEGLGTEEQDAIERECAARLARENPLAARRMEQGKAGRLVRALLDGYRDEALRAKVIGERS